MNASCVLALAFVAAISGGCAGGDETNAPTSRESSGSTSSATGTDPVAGTPQGRTLSMPKGNSRASFKIIALAPPEHSWDVRVVAPTTADVAVRIRTWYGQRLRVLDTTHDDTSCDVQAGRSVCLLAFPKLEAQRPGEWTVIVAKRSHPAADVRVEVVFNQE